MLAYNMKWFFLIISHLTGISIALNLLPNFHQFSDKDAGLWLLAFEVVSAIQVMLLVKVVSGCYICRVWSDCVLQVNGVLFILLSAAFAAKYPPFTWAMVVFPVLGVACLILGRIFSKKSRLRLQGHRQNGAFNLLG